MSDAEEAPRASTSTDNEVQVQINPPMMTSTPKSSPKHRTVFVTDTRVFTPKSFTGKTTNNEGTHWLRYFDNYIEYRQLSQDDARKQFRLLMTEKAADWMLTLTAETNNNMIKLKKAITHVDTGRTEYIHGQAHLS